jgi:hypothetical protein
MEQSRFVPYFTYRTLKACALMTCPSANAPRGFFSSEDERVYWRDLELRSGLRKALS